MSRILSMTDSQANANLVSSESFKFCMTAGVVSDFVIEHLTLSFLSGDFVRWLLSSITYLHSIFLIFCDNVLTHWGQNNIYWSTVETRQFFIRSECKIYLQTFPKIVLSQTNQLAWHDASEFLITITKFWRYVDVPKFLVQLLMSSRSFSLLIRVV